MLVFISLGLLWPDLKTPPESKQQGPGMEVRVQAHHLFGAVSSHDGLRPRCLNRRQ